ncbi:MAG: hypothetical protein AAFQ94_22365 [Bacteroidota bacterium]
MKSLIINSKFLLFTATILFSCGVNQSTEQVDLQTLSLVVCDSTYQWEKPEWWDTTEVLLVDSIIESANDTRNYLNLLRKSDPEKYYHYMIADDLSYRKYLKTLYSFHQQKNESLDEFVRLANQYVSHQVAADLNSIVYNCSADKQNYYMAKRIAENYYQDGQLDKALKYFQEAKKLRIDNGNTDTVSVTDKINFIDNISDRTVFLKSHLGFRGTLDSLTVNVEILRGGKWIDKLDKASLSNLETNFPQLNVSRKSQLMEEPDVLLALQFLVFNDINADQKVVNRNLLAAVKEEFQTYNEISHDNFEVHVSRANLQIPERNEWTLAFWASGSDISGLAVAEFTGYKFEGIYMVD